jgi:hypothetical protein
MICYTKYFCPKLLKSIICFIKGHEADIKKDVGNNFLTCQRCEKRNYTDYLDRIWFGQNVILRVGHKLKFWFMAFTWKYSNQDASPF